MNETIEKLHIEIRAMQRDKVNWNYGLFSETHRDRLNEIDSLLGRITFEIGHSHELDQCKTKVFNMIDYIDDGE